MRFIISTAGAILAAAIASNATAQPLPGAIFTTDRDGTVVDGNLYEDCCDVFLNGGPPPNAPCTSAGLPDGDYYFQVTNPSGSVLLSNDNIEQRRFRVQGGLIVQYYGTSGDCVHETGLGKCNASNPSNISVQLMPFDETTNPGHVYKAWATRVSDYAPGNPSSVHGFLHHRSKTDNFKCVPDGEPCVATVIIEKYYDANGNGVNDGEEPLDGVRFTVMVTPPGGTETTFTVETGADGRGQVMFDVPPDSLVIVCEQVPGSGDPNCHWEQTEPVESSINAVLINGQWCYCTVLDGCEVETFRFGDICICDPVSGGNTIAYWCGTGGKNTLHQNEPNWRQQLNAMWLRKANGANFDIGMPPKGFNGAYGKFDRWMDASNDANNMAYALSAQLAATKLTCTYRNLNEAAHVLLPPALAEKYGEPMANIMLVVQEANARLHADGHTPAGDPNRPRQQTLKQILEGINGNNFAGSPGIPCDIVYGP